MRTIVKASFSADTMVLAVSYSFLLTNLPVKLSENVAVAGANVGDKNAWGDKNKPDEMVALLRDENSGLFAQRCEKAEIPHPSCGKAEKRTVKSR